MVAKSAGRTHRTWRESIRPAVLAKSQVCLWCGHAGAKAVNHNLPKSRFPDQAHNPDHLAAIHGTEGCPLCPTRNGKRRVCNNEVGDRIPFVEVFPPDHGSRQW